MKGGASPCSNLAGLHFVFFESNADFGAVIISSAKIAAGSVRAPFL